MVNKRGNIESKRNLFAFAILLVLFLLVSAYMIFFIDAEKVISMIGVTNAYGLMFVLTLISGMSSFSSGLIYTSLFTLLKGGANPLILGIIAGSGIAIGDVFFYYMFSKGHQSLSAKTQKRVQIIIEKFEKKNDRVIPIFIVLWAFLPLPNDIMTISTSVMGYPLRKAYPYIIIGDLGHMILASFLFFQTFL